MTQNNGSPAPRTSQDTDARHGSHLSSNHVDPNHADVSGDIKDLEALNQYLKTEASTRTGRRIPPLEQWNPKETVDMDLIIKANGEWWHEGSHMTRESLISLFATVLWVEEQQGQPVYYLKTPVQKLRITVEDAPLFINDVGIVTEGDQQWLEFTTMTGDVVRLDDEHPITLRAYTPTDTTDTLDEDQDTTNVRPYMPVRNGLEALIGRNVFYHLIEIGTLSEQGDQAVLTLSSGGQSYEISMPNDA